MSVRMKGRGKVVGQSVASGSKVVKGQTITLELN
jgi:beta-lactam-binding protein with PASTA domain